MLDQLRGELPADTTVRLSFAPAEAAQVDFGAGPMLTHPDGRVRRTWAFVMTLAHCRHQYVEFVWDQSSATWVGCHRRAFEWFDGVPLRVIIDNAKCAIIKACAHDPLVQRAYAECAEGYNFKIDACPPRDSTEEQPVESGVKYVKGNFLPTRTFRDLADLNAQARSWVMTEAGVRVHGTTREQPLVLFEAERALLRRLPPIAPDLGTWHRVVLHRDCHVQCENPPAPGAVHAGGQDAVAARHRHDGGAVRRLPTPVHPPARAAPGPARDGDGSSAAGCASVL